jgi:hypothetical protein
MDLKALAVCCLSSAEIQKQMPSSEPLPLFGDGLFSTVWLLELELSRLFSYTTFW